MTDKPTYEELEQRVKELEKKAGKRKEAEKELRKYQFMIESAHDAIFFKDLGSRYISANDKTLETFGLSREDVIGKNDYELMPDQKEAKKNVHDDQIVFKSGKPTEVFKHMTGADGKEFWFQAIKVPQFDNDGKVIGLVGIARDITDRKQAEEALRESEERYRSLAENSLVGFWQITLEGYTTYINPAMCSMIDIESPKELSGQTYHSFFTSESLEMINHERAKRPEGRGSCYEGEIIGKNGGRRNVMICGAPLLSTKGKLHGYIATFTEITDRKRAEEKLRKAHDKLDHRVKERTKDLEIKTKSLEEINIALEVLLRKREEDKTELEDNVLTNVKELIVPYFEKIKKTKLDNQQETFLSIIESYVNEIISPFTRKMSLKYLNLTPTEIQIANLIKHGSHTKKIAELLNVSPRTVETHRKNIRRKIGLENKRANLRSHLLSLH
jgi:PAS domain S-box-containing protein